jgi:adenylate cyclase
MDKCGLTFGPFVLNSANGTLLRNGELLPIGRRGIRLLEALLQRPGEVLTKAELMDAAWPGMTVEEANLSVQIASLRKLLGPAPGGGEWIATIPRVGYRFLPAADATGEHGSAARNHAQPIPSKRSVSGARWFAVVALAAVVAVIGAVALRPVVAPPTPVVASLATSLAVLPFDDMTGNAELAYLGDGVAEDIISMLARVPELTVVARNSSFAYKGQAVDIRKVGKELGATHVLEGSVRKNADQVRIVAQLIDARTGNHVWAERFDRWGADPWELQDEVTGKIVAALVGHSGTVRRAEYRETWGRDSAGLQEYDYYLRAQYLAHAGTSAHLEQAAAVSREGLQKFPNSSLIKVQLAATVIARHANGWSDSLDPERDFREAGRQAREALALPGAPPIARKIGHWVLAYASLGERNYDQALSEAEASLALAPYDGFWVYALSEIPIAAGHPERTIEWVERVSAMYREDDPRLRLLGAAKAHALTSQGRFQEALVAVGDARGLLPGYVLLRAYLLAETGRIDEAKAVVARLLEIYPGFSQDQQRRRNFFFDPAVLEPLIEVLAMVGLPEN